VNKRKEGRNAIVSVKRTFVVGRIRGCLAKGREKRIENNPGGRGKERVYSPTFEPQGNRESDKEKRDQMGKGPIQGEKFAVQSK